MSSFDLVFCVGDIHGRLDLLMRMDKRIHDEANNIPHHEAGTYLLGDYVDRGPDSKGVIDYLAGGRKVGGLLTECILGNHDLWMASAIDKFKKNNPSYEEWFQHSYIHETLRSYGVSLETIKNIDMSSKEYDKKIPSLMKAFVKRVPDNHLDFLKKLSPINMQGVILCHAGVNDQFSLNNQSIPDLTGGLRGFLDYKYNFDGTNFEGMTCIVGHTEKTCPYMNEEKTIVDIDTGAWRTGILTACVVVDKMVKKFIAVTDDLNTTPVIVDLMSGNDDDNNLEMMADWWRDVVSGCPDKKPVFCFKDKNRLYNFMAKTNIKVGKSGHEWTEYLKRKKFYTLMPANYQTEQIIRRKSG